MTVRVVCAGDIHLGRHSSKVSERFRTTEAFANIVDHAISAEADVLALSGDIVDKQSKSYESIGPIQDGLRRLDAAGIETVAVAGNHDYDVLPRIMEFSGTDRFHLLGQDGHWGRYSLVRSGKAILHVNGWSFPSEHVRDSPLPYYRMSSDDSAPVLGLLHADVGNPRSVYAPVSIEQLWATGVSVWLLGHVHMNHRYESPDGKLAMYPASSYAMDPGEPGSHGIWQVDLAEGRPAVTRFIAISPVYYHQQTIEMSPVTDEGSFQALLAEALNQIGREVRGSAPDSPLRVISCRIRLVGRSGCHHQIPHWSDRAKAQMRSYPIGSVAIEIDQITSDVRPEVELERLAIGTSPVSEVARLILGLQDETNGSQYSELINSVADGMGQVDRHAAYVALDRHADRAGNTQPQNDEAKHLLISQSWQLLSSLLSQKEPR